MLTNEQIQLIRDSWAAVELIRDDAAALFYAKLFARDPGLEKLFTGDMQEQGRKLMSMLGMAVNALDRLDAVIPALQDLGRRHAERDYDAVGTALLETLEVGLGDLYSPATGEAWALAYGSLANLMKAAAAESACA